MPKYEKIGPLMKFKSSMSTNFILTFIKVSHALKVSRYSWFGDML